MEKYSEGQRNKTSDWFGTGAKLQDLEGWLRLGPSGILLTDAGRSVVTLSLSCAGKIFANVERGGG